MGEGGESMADFEQIYAQYFPSVYKFVYSMCRNPDVAEEVTQEAFYKAMMHIHRFDGTCQLYVWLCQISNSKNAW